MSIDLITLANQTKVVSDLREKLAKARSDYANVRALHGQRGYDVVIGGARITVADMDPHTYQAKLVRGCEMIHLGALKALDARVDGLAERVKHEEQKLARIAAGEKP